MRRTRLRAASLLAALALGGAGYFMPRAAAQKSKKPRVDARAVYVRHCARCHGAEGAADTERGKLYNATNFTDADWWDRERPTNSRLRRLIVHGGSGMPPYGQRLSAAQIDALVPLVRSFKGK